MGKLSTHVLDTACGKPAAGVKVELFRETITGAEKVAESLTNRDGRTDEPLLAGDAFEPGTYRLLFHIGDYFSAVGAADAGKFLHVVPIEFVVADAAAAYHVPLLVSPWSYSTYRGS